MIMQLVVHKEVFNKWDANPTTGMKAGESFDLLCLDVSDPAEHRMEEMLYYRLKPAERQFWGTFPGKTISVGVAKIKHGDKTGKATLIGSLLVNAEKFKGPPAQPKAN